MPVFDSGPWEFLGGADHLISHFDYLNSSDRVEAARVRAVVEEMFGRYPAAAQEALRHRLRSIDDNTHLSAFFELTLHDIVLRAGCVVLAVEPDMPGSSRSPDFLVETAEGQRFYLEGTMATGRSRSEEGAERRLREALQVIDSVRSPDFFFDLRISGTPIAPVSGRQIRRGLESWLQGLNYEQVRSVWEQDTGAVPVFRYEQNGVEFRISPVPRRSSRGNLQRTRAIGSRMLPALSVQPHEPIRSAIGGKATRYGQLDAPYIVAVNAMSDYADADDAVNAVFGTPAVFVRQTADGYEDRLGRQEDGVWRGASGPINTRVSAVLSTERLNAWSLGQRRARLILNPWAARPLPISPLQVDVVDVHEERLREVSGLSLREILTLPEGWPE
ncbi:MAG TPA: hypothetical protein VM659_03265 [Dongiaceae bacterium]|nr:hypothetical protein [Dongiaceae bacterium]